MSGIGWNVISGGDRWHISQSTEALGWLAQLPSACVDAVITDPPYSSGGQFRGDRAGTTSEKYVNSDVVTERPEFAGDNRDQRAFAYWCALWLAECQRIAKPGAPFCLFTDWRQLPTVTDLLQAGGLVWRGIAVWDKTEGARPQLGAFRSQCEYIVWGTNGPRDEEACAEVGVLPGVFRVVVRQDDKFHITGKPTALMNEVVKICRPGGLILDPFCGSGTTLVGALLQGRRAIGCERVAEYAEIASKRCAAIEDGTDWRNPTQLGLLKTGDK